MPKKVTTYLSLLFLGLLFFSSSSFSTTHMISVQNFSFSPASVNAIVGDTVTWQWVEGSHTTTCDGVFPGTSLPPGASTWDSPINSTVTSFSYVIEVDGDYNYVCIPHSPNMAGMILATPLPVELVSFTATVSGGFANLSWKTATEKNNKGFEIQRKTGATWDRVTFIEGHGTSTRENSYSFRDNISTLSSNEIYYRLKQIDLNGTYEYSQEIMVSKTVPSDFTLMQNFPNPFNPSTLINYSIPRNSFVMLKVYDSNGSEVATLVSENKVSGNYTVNFNASDLASGIYYYTINAGSFREARKMILMK